MSDWIIGIAMGIVVGLAVGIILSRGKQKRWSELTKREKRVRITLVVVLAVLVVAGVVVMLVI
ncbi:MAG: hypothetical protein PVJ08_07760 [Dehalococcoidia bacterium]|jgi:NhaP-type Na+/H+ or K+/H+ antiporter